MLHLELLHHFTIDTYVPEMGQELFHSTELVIRTGFHAPYLMVQALALSARRLSTSCHSMKQTYLDHAMKLQTHAVSLFNADKSELDETSSVAKLLFSSILGRHLLSDALAVREPDLIPFLDNYVRYARLHRSIKALAGYAWPFLLHSVLKDAVMWGTEIIRVQPNGHECDLVIELLESSALDNDSRQACRKAIHFLQIGFDEAQCGQVQGRTMQILLWWCILVPEQFIDMLAYRQPEAIAVLGYYAALLKYGKGVWLIGNAGSYLLEEITCYLGVDWADWLVGAEAV
ncbi:c6 finger domain-containing protein [Fusarium flagelliforme]|uniref:C6 finger domain-containing protein n=2 Tax=Fusarium flagelliforme TaxID=2675880 RepID=A0A395MIU5_9HYPO|nr:c6 finger domain-containing protein [Fusarium flagelliforme]